MFDGITNLSKGIKPFYTNKEIPTLRLGSINTVDAANYLLEYVNIPGEILFAWTDYGDWENKIKKELIVCRHARDILNRRKHLVAAVAMRVFVEQEDVTSPTGTWKSFYQEVVGLDSMDSVEDSLTAMMSQLQYLILGAPNV